MATEPAPDLSSILFIPSPNPIPAIQSNSMLGWIQNLFPNQLIIMQTILKCYKINVF